MTAPQKVIIAFVLAFCVICILSIVKLNDRIVSVEEEVHSTRLYLMVLHGSRVDQEETLRRMAQ